MLPSKHTCIQITFEVTSQYIGMLKSSSDSEFNWPPQKRSTVGPYIQNKISYYPTINIPVMKLQLVGHLRNDIAETYHT